MTSDEYNFVKNTFGVSRETFERLKIYQELLLKWQAKINLIGPDTVSDSWNRHFVDSLQILPYIDDKNAVAVDMGTGAGFPGMVMAIAGMANVHLIESDTKKIIFLKEVARLTHTDVSIHHMRIEEATIDNVKLIFSRACSSLSQLLSYSQNYVSRETKCLFHKGKNYSKELLDSQSDWLFDYSVYPSITDAQGSILQVTNLRMRPKNT